MAVLFTAWLCREKDLFPAHTRLPPSAGISLPPKGHYFCANAIKGQWLPQAWQSRAEQRGCRNLRSHNNHYSPPPILTLRLHFLCFLPPTPIVPPVTFRRAPSLQWDSLLECNKKQQDLIYNTTPSSSLLPADASFCLCGTTTHFCPSCLYLQTWNQLSKQYSVIFMKITTLTANIWEQTYFQQFCNPSGDDWTWKRHNSTCTAPAPHLLCHFHGSVHCKSCRF